MTNWEGLEIEGRLGVGATGTVWLARQVALGRRVAVKELAVELAGDAAVRERLRQEARVLARLDHPNCVAVYNYLESDSRAAIVMEYVEGVSLRAVSDGPGLTVEQALLVLEGALTGLAYAHNQNILHGDIKPENILLATSGTSKLVDFGLSVVVGSRRPASVGSPGYASPEAAAGAPLGVASDVYSAALVLSELLAGRTAPGGGMASVAEDTRGLPGPVAVLLDRALNPDAALRPSTALSFLEELRAAADQACGSDWRRRAGLAPLLAAAASGAAGAVGVAKASADTPADTEGTPAGVRARLVHTHPWAAAVTAAVVLVAVGVGLGFAATKTFSPSPSNPVPARASLTPPSTITPTGPSSRTSPGPLAYASTASAICSLVYPTAPGPGMHCMVTNLRVSGGAPQWAYGAIAFYNNQNELDSDVARVIVNLSDDHVIGPTNVGFCGVGTTAGTPAPGYSAIPPNVLTQLQLLPCEQSTPATGGGSTVATSLPPGSAPYAFLSGTWGAHEMSLMITPSGMGHLEYADLTLCPDCSFDSAPRGTMDFALTSVTNGTARGSVTASSDPKNDSVGESVTASLAAGSPGQLLEIQIGGVKFVNFCNSTSTGQCGA
jgi:predicted Ser/Thr protein kinase